MKDKDKIALANLVLSFLGDMNKDTTNHPKMIGTLNKRQGFNGFKPIEVGTPVFEKADRYILVMESSFRGPTAKRRLQQCALMCLDAAV